MLSDHLATSISRVRRMTEVLKYRFRYDSWLRHTAHGSTRTAKEEPWGFSQHSSEAKIQQVVHAADVLWLERGNAKIEIYCPGSVDDMG